VPHALAPAAAKRPRPQAAQSALELAPTGDVAPAGQGAQAAAEAAPGAALKVPAGHEMQPCAREAAPPPASAA